MILPLAMLLGVIGAISRSLYNRKAPIIPELKLVWLVVAGFLIQYLIFFEPTLREQLTTSITAIMLSASYCLLFIFAWLNNSRAGFWFLGIGVTLNLVVIIANGGFMPVTPETILRLELPSDYVEQFMVVGQRFPNSKDIVLLQDDTWFWWLSDIFVLPKSWFWWRSYGIAFSVGDILIALGAIRFFWASGAPEQSQPSLAHSLTAT